MLSLGSGLLRQIHKGTHLLPLNSFLVFWRPYATDCPQFRSSVHRSSLFGAASWLGCSHGGPHTGTAAGRHRPVLAFPAPAPDTPSGLPADHSAHGGGSHAPPVNVLIVRSSPARPYGQLGSHSF